MASIAVVGAGMVGTWTADLLRKRLPASIEVTQIAEKFTTETTSYGAAGIYRMNNCDFVDPHRLDKWMKLSFDHYHHLARSAMAPIIGANTLKVYHLFTEPNTKRPLFTDYCYDFRTLSQKELKYMEMPSQYVSGMLVTTVMIEPRYYLPFLLDSFRTNGGRISKRNISSWSELEKEFDLVVNCSGAGSRTLCNDDSIYPVRGQVVRVHAPWLRHGFFVEQPDTYIYPGRDSVVLGGIRQKGSWSTEISTADTDTVLQRCRAIEPSLIYARTEEIWAGIRPFRKQIRVEADPYTYCVPIVHNYGHGGYGIQLGYPTAVEAVELVTDLLKDMRHKL